MSSQCRHRHPSIPGPHSPPSKMDLRGFANSFLNKSQNQSQINVDSAESQTRIPFRVRPSIARHAGRGERGAFLSSFFRSQTAVIFPLLAILSLALHLDISHRRQSAETPRAHPGPPPRRTGAAGGGSGSGSGGEGGMRLMAFRSARFHCLPTTLQLGCAAVATASERGIGRRTAATASIGE